MLSCIRGFLDVPEGCGVTGQALIADTRTALPRQALEKERR